MFTDLNKRAFSEFQNKSWQVKNRFEFILIPSTVSVSETTFSTANNITNIITGVAGLYVIKLHLREITFPVGPTFDYETIHEHKFISKVNFGDNVTLRFIEDEEGTVIRYLMQWMNDTYVMPDVTSILSFPKPLQSGRILGTGYALRENQLAAKRTGMVLLEEKGGNRDVPIYPRIMLWGLGIQAIAPVTLNHEDANPLEYEVTCSLDRVYIPTGI